MLKFFKKETQVPEKSIRHSNFPSSRPENYYGRFTLTQVDDEVEENVLRKWLLEVKLDFDNNRIKFEESDLAKYKKQMNFCYFFRCRIEYRIKELLEIQDLNRKIISKLNGTKTDRWRLLVEFITKRYPGVKLNEIMLLMDLEK